MRSYITWCMVCFTLTLLQAEEASPMDMLLPAGQETKVTCFVKGRSYNKSHVGEGTTEDDSDGNWEKAYHYKLYIPKSYDKSKNQYFPCMFIASPGGNANMGQMANRFKNDNWVVVMLIESKNGTPDWLPSFIAAHDDVLKRVRICPNFKFATGMSGGARCVSEYTYHRKGFRGVILQAAGFSSWEYEKYPKHTAVASTFGNEDFNLSESQKIRRNLNPKTPSYIEVFKGGHNWAPEETFIRALDWIEQKTFIQFKQKATKQQRHAFVWLMKQKLNHLKTATSDVEKYHLIHQILTVANNGGLTSIKAYRPTLLKLRNKLLKLKKKKRVYSEIQAERAFKKTQLKIDSFNKQMLKAKAVFKRNLMCQKDMRAFEGMKTELKKLSERYPNTQKGQAAKTTLTSLTYEFQKIEAIDK